MTSGADVLGHMGTLVSRTTADQNAASCRDVLDDMCQELDSLPCIESINDFSASQDPGWSALGYKEVAGVLRAFTSSEDVQYDSTFSAISTAILTTVNLMHTSSPGADLLELLSKVLQRSQKCYSLTDLLTAAFLACQVLMCPSPSSTEGPARLRKVVPWCTISRNAQGLLARTVQETIQLYTTHRATCGTQASALLWTHQQIVKAISKVLVHHILLASEAVKDDKQKKTRAAVLDITGLLNVVVQTHINTSPNQAVHADTSVTSHDSLNDLCSRVFCMVVGDIFSAVCKPGVSAQCANSAQNLLIDVIIKVAHEDTAHAAQLVLLLVSLIHNRFKVQSAQTTGLAASDTVDETAAFLLGVITTLVLKFGDPDLAATVLQAVHPAISSNRGYVRKLVLDIASLVLESPHGSAAIRLAVMCMEQGAQDKDGTVRAKAMSCLALKAGHILAAGNALERTGTHNERSIAVHVATLASTRLLDATKTVRARALDVLHSLLTTETKQASNDETRKSIATLALPSLYQLLDARQDSPLYDAGNIQMVESVLHEAVHMLGPMDMCHHHHHHQQQQQLNTHTGQQAHHAAPHLSMSLQKRLIQRCQVPDPSAAFDIWSLHLAGSTTTDVDQVRCLVDDLDPALKAALAQEAVRRVCMAMAEHTAVQEKQGSTTDAASLIAAGNGDVAKAADTIQAALKVLYCFKMSHTGRDSDASLTGKPAGSPNGQDIVCEAAILLDACSKMLNGMQSASTCVAASVKEANQDMQAAAMADAAMSSSIKTPSNVMQRLKGCVVWCFVTLSHMLDMYYASHETGSKQQAAVPAAADHNSPHMHSRQPTLTAYPQAPSLSQIILKALPALLKSCLCQPCCGTAVIEAALKLLCNCPGGAVVANKLLRQLEHELQQCMDQSDNDSNITKDTASGCMQYMFVLQQYILLLGHMSSLYEKEYNMMVDKALQARLAAKQQRIHPLITTTASEHTPELEPQHDTREAKHEGTVQDQYNYMANEEAVQSAHTVAQEYVEKLIGSTAPGTRADVLARLAQAGQQENAATMPAGIQAAALWALSQLMAMSLKLATQHVGLLQAALIQPIHKDDGDGGSDQPASEGAAVVASTALEACGTLLLRNPNVFGDVLPAMEDLLHYLLAQGKISRPADTNLLYKAVVCYTQVLSAEKLKLQGGTWRLLATLVLSDNAHIKAVTLQLLRSLLSASHLNKTGSKAGGKGGARKSRVPGTVPAGNAAIVQGVAGQYKAGIMLLYSNCDEKCRKQLIEEVLMGEGLLSTSDLCHDGLVLAAVQALGLADTAASRSAAACLISHMTPSSKAVAALEAMLQGSGLGLNRVPAAEAQSIIQVLITFVGRCKVATTKILPNASLNSNTVSGRQTATNTGSNDQLVNGKVQGDVASDIQGTSVKTSAAAAVPALETQQEGDRTGPVRVLATLNVLANSLKGKPVVSRTIPITNRSQQPSMSTQAGTVSFIAGGRPGNTLNKESTRSLRHMQSQPQDIVPHPVDRHQGVAHEKKKQWDSVVVRHGQPGKGVAGSSRAGARSRTKVNVRDIISDDDVVNSSSEDDKGFQETHTMRTGRSVPARRSRARNG